MVKKGYRIYYDEKEDLKLIIVGIPEIRYGREETWNLP